MTLDHPYVVDLVNGSTNEVMTHLELVENKLLDKARLIAKRKNADTDPDLFRRLNEEQKFVEASAAFLDKVKAHMNLLAELYRDTQDGYFAQAIEGSKHLEDLKILRDTLAIKNKNEEQYLSIIKSQNNKLREQQTA